MLDLAPRTDELLAAYRRDGFVVLRDAFPQDRVEELRREAVRICRGELGEVGGMKPGTPDESDDDVMARTLCIHFPHKISPVMLAAMKDAAVVEPLTRLISPNVKAMQSMLFIKSAGQPGQAWHQDEYFIPTRDRSLCGAWIALDDATVDNGCLWVIPGSHTGVIYPQRDHGDYDRFDCTGEAFQFPYSDSDAVPVEVATGSVVIFNGYLLHRSEPNRRSGGFRRALVNHYMSAESLLPWYPVDQSAFAIQDVRDVVLVAGTDPYAWKGTVNHQTPHVRPVGEGGCGRPSDKDA